MALVLCTGAHTTLVHTRKLILERADHTVVAAFDDSSLITACRQHKFDVAVICQSGSPALKRDWLAKIRTLSPSTKVLEVYTRETGTVLSEADGWIEAPTTPDELAATLSRLVGIGSGAERATRENIRRICARAVTAQGAEFYVVLEELEQAINSMLGEE